MATFDELLLSYAYAGDETARQAIEAQLWATYGREEAVLVLDMSGFSLLTQRHGIIHYLSMIRRMHTATRPVIERYRGRLVKFEADNCFSRFPTVHDAVQAAIGINLAMAGMNLMTPDPFDIRVACGIDFGRFLLVDDGDFFGDPVNMACKLGEDLGEPGEILMTDRAMHSLAAAACIQSTCVEFVVSGMQLIVHRILY